MERLTLEILRLYLNVLRETNKIRIEYEQKRIKKMFRVLN